MNYEELVQNKNWVVIGDTLNSSKYAYKILNKLKEKGYNVAGVFPSDDREKGYKSLKDVPYTIDVIDLCINSMFGIDFIKEAKELGIKKVLIQPGAESSEILNYCKSNGINALEGCALVALSLYKK